MKHRFLPSVCILILNLFLTSACVYFEDRGYQSSFQDTEFRDTVSISTEVNATGVHDTNVNDTTVVDSGVNDTLVHHTEVNPTDVRDTEVNPTDIRDTEVGHTDFISTDTHDTEIHFTDTNHPEKYEQSTDSGVEITLPDSSLKLAYADYFPIGVAVSHRDVTQNIQELVHQQFNQITAENAMKFGPIHPDKDKYAFDGADAIAEFARTHNIRMTGHTLVWHQQYPEWLFSDLTPGNEKDIETLKKRLQDHTNTIVERYYDVVDNWDVVNEAISDDPEHTYRQDSAWYKAFGSNDYIYWAFKYTKEALEAVEPGGSAGKLYYNDFNMNQKIERTLDMLDWLENDKGIRIDGVGLQGHWTLGWPSVSELELTIDAFVEAGFKVKISELDITIYSDYSGGYQPEAEKEFSDALNLQQMNRYRDIFELFRRKAQHITSVTLWGVSDATSWLDNHPVPDRNNHPLLFDDDYQAKDAFYSIVDFSE